MNNSLEKEIFELQKKQLQKVLGRDINVDEKGYLSSINDNIYEKMMTPHIMEYGKGSGNELVGNMRSIRSSSAMTFNLLGNKLINLYNSEWFKDGEYFIEYEKQFRTLKSSGNPANLDAYLYCPQDSKLGQNIFCEMKMTEWMNNPSNSYPGKLKKAYTIKDNYYDLDAAEIFLGLIETFKKSEDDRYVTSIFDQYDVWQMLKHTIAIFNGFRFKQIVDLENKEKVVLLNIIWQPNEKFFHLNQQTIKNKLEEEKKQSKEFELTMMNEENGLKKLFLEKCNVEFSIKCISVNEFVSYIKDSSRKEYLKRYTLI